MPVDDECSVESGAASEAWDFVNEMCIEAQEAAWDWAEALENLAQDCADAAGAPPEEITDDMDPMLVHVLESEWAEYNEKVADCMDASSSEVMDAEAKAQDLLAACEIAAEEADALQSELDACLHALHSGIPFA